MTTPGLPKARAAGVFQRLESARFENQHRSEHHALAD
jgi:hypothetical protein